MRTMPSVIGAAIALTLLIGSPTSVLSQAGNSENEAHPSREITRGIFDALVVDAPFSAETITTWQPRAGGAERRATARYYRDRAGRVRVEQMFVGHAGDQAPQRVLVAPDGTNMAYVLDPAARTIEEWRRGGAGLMVGGYHGSVTLPVSMTRSIDFLGFPSASSEPSRVLDEEALGQRSIAGIQAMGTRIKATLPPAIDASGSVREIERWVSPELKLVVYSRSVDSLIGTVEHQLTRISRAEPPEEFFEVPEDYVATVGKGPWSWANPYRPDLTPWLKP